MQISSAETQLMFLVRDNYQHLIAAIPVNFCYFGQVGAPPLTELIKSPKVWSDTFKLPKLGSSQYHMS